MASIAPKAPSYTDLLSISPEKKVDLISKASLFKQEADGAWDVLQSSENDIPWSECIQLAPTPTPFHCDPRDVAACVDVRLERDQDRTPRRIELSHRVKRKMEEMLKTCFSAECPPEANDLKSSTTSARTLAIMSESTKQILRARVVVVSEGSAMSRTCGVGALSGSGRAKLVVAWYLQDVRSGYVVIGRRMVRTDSLKFGIEDIKDWSAGERAVMRMAEKITHEISKEVLEKIQKITFRKNGVEI